MTRRLETSNEQAWKRVLESLHSTAPVEGFTHNYYNYPARFDPTFVRSVITEFTRPDDVVFDPFMGGGTAIVEAVAAGRRAIGFDINPLALFLATVKTTPLSGRDEDAIRQWATSLKSQITWSSRPVGEQVDRRLFNLPEDVAGLFRKAAWSTRVLEFPRQRRFGRCVLLAWGQWLLDNRRYSPGARMIKDKLVSVVEDQLDGLRAYVEVATNNGVAKNRLTGRRRLYCGSASDLASINVGDRLTSERPKLVLTSPPYPGVHVLYHRWQVKGRRETPAPYYLAGLVNGHYASHYTMGSRTQRGVNNYFAELRHTFESLRGQLDPEATVVQLVGFSDCSYQLPLYMSSMAAAGYGAIGPSAVFMDSSVFRRVPNRKWYIRTGATREAAGKEFLICHAPN